MQNLAACAHRVTVVRYKVDALGRRLYASQCEQCRDRIGDWIAHTDGRVTNALPWRDDDPRQGALF